MEGWHPLLQGNPGSAPAINTPIPTSILEGSDLCWNFSSIPKDGSDIHKFPSVHVLLVGKSWPIRAILRYTGKIPM